MMISDIFSALPFHFKFFDIFSVFLIATLLFAVTCERKPMFRRKAVLWILGIRLLCLLFAYTYGGSIFLEVIYSAILLFLMLVGLMNCYQERLWNILFYFGSGFMTWYITDRLFLVTASFCRLDPMLSRYFVEDTLPHILLYMVDFILVYSCIYHTLGKKMHRFSGSEIPMQNSLLLFVLVSILTPIFYFESYIIANYDLLLYNLLNVGEIIFYFSMLLLQVQMLVSAKERTELHAIQTLWKEEQRQYRLVKENIDAINIKCHDLKHQIRDLRKSGQVDESYLDSLEQSVNIYNSTVQTGNETLDVVLTDKRLHCATHEIQFTCMAEGDKMCFMEVMDIFSLFGNMLDNAIECEMGLPAEMRFIHLSARCVNQMMHIHVENPLNGRLEFRDGLPVTTKEDKDYHGYGMLSIKRIVEQYKGNLLISTEDGLFQVDIILPIPS